MHFLPARTQTVHRSLAWHGFGQATPNSLGPLSKPFLRCCCMVKLHITSSELTISAQNCVCVCVCVCVRVCVLCVRVCVCVWCEGPESKTIQTGRPAVLQYDYCIRCTRSAGYFGVSAYRWTYVVHRFPLCPYKCYMFCTMLQYILSHLPA